MRDIFIGVITAAVIGLGALIVKFLARRVKASDPLALAVRDLIPRVNFMLSTQGIHTDALIALLETTKGKCNGNVDDALDKTKELKDQYTKFIQSAAKIEEPVA